VIGVVTVLGMAIAAGVAGAGGERE